MTSWKVKVHPRQPVTYLWGGEQVKVALDTVALLTFRVDELGEPIEFGTRNDTSSPIKPFGTLLPGESFTISLKQMRGVWANCVDQKVDTQVYCCLHVPSVT